MIYYFSGTGNSYAAAKFLAEGLGEDLMDIAAAVREGNYEHKLEEGEKLGFVFPFTPGHLLRLSLNLLKIWNCIIPAILIFSQSAPVVLLPAKPWIFLKKHWMKTVWCWTAAFLW